MVVVVGVVVVVRVLPCVGVGARWWARLAGAAPMGALGARKPAACAARGCEQEQEQAVGRPMLRCVSRAGARAALQC